ncbi:phage head closure protein [Bacillus sp. AG4(2022)]|uniref:phage head closure protein n=1 Tax=Bacillus sp. AG4(2022) TaxID=2962594 RepID=UPI00288289A7|nr:phage head closure protein [Bacillus sp. AG4(2022)]MDT0163822.1 phage head closure protein [Bacillus sp. AG4(2022)]
MARWSEIVELLTLEEGTNENGFPETVVAKRQTVFVNKKSIRSSEFYAAAQSGYSLELMFEIRSIDYGSEEHLNFDNRTYEIVRTFDKGELTELICQSYGEGEVL